MDKKLETKFKNAMLEHLMFNGLPRDPVAKVRLHTYISANIPMSERVNNITDSYDKMLSMMTSNADQFLDGWKDATADDCRKQLDMLIADVLKNIRSEM